MLVHHHKPESHAVFKVKVTEKIHIFKIWLFKLKKERSELLNSQPNLSLTSVVQNVGGSFFQHGGERVGLNELFLSILHILN